MLGEQIVNVIKDAAANGQSPTSIPDLIWGTVTSTNPMKIQVQNEPKLVLTSQFLILSPWCRERKLTIETKPHKHTATVKLPKHSHKIGNSNHSHSVKIEVDEHNHSLYPLQDHMHTIEIDGKDYVSKMGIGDGFSHYIPSDTGTAGGTDKTITSTSANGAPSNTQGYDFPSNPVTVVENTIDMKLSGTDGGKALPVSQNTITLNEGLAVGDNVIMLRVSNGNKYYVLQKEG